LSQVQSTKYNGDEYRKVILAVRDFIFEQHRFPQVNDIVDKTSIKKLRCDEIVDQLVKQKQLYVAFKGEGLPTIVLLYDMMQGVLMTQKKPDWMEGFGFTERTEIAEKIHALQNEAISYEQFERLLYGADIPLEEAIAHTLDWLGFLNVIHHKDDTDNPDVTFEFNGVKGLLEAEGTTKAGDKRKISQLKGWAEREIEQGKGASEIKGFFAVNHFRDIEPPKRGDPLTTHAKEFLKLYRYAYFTTPFLLELIKQVKDHAVSKEDAQKMLWEGEKIK
jgi:hypothetical protein